jgi:hypothetical protein
VPRPPRISLWTRLGDARSGRRYGRRGLPAPGADRVLSTPRIESINQWHRHAIEISYADFLRSTQDQRRELHTLREEVSRAELTLAQLEAELASWSLDGIHLDRLQGEEALSDEMLRIRRRAARARRLKGIEARVEHERSALVTRRARMAELEGFLSSALEGAQSQARSIHVLARTRVTRHSNALLATHPEAATLFGLAAGSGLSLPAWVEAPTSQVADAARGTSTKAMPLRSDDVFVDLRDGKAAPSTPHAYEELR